MNGSTGGPVPAHPARLITPHQRQKPKSKRILIIPMRKALRSIWRILTAPFRFIFRLFRNIWRWFARTFGKIRAFFTDEIDDAPVTDAFNKAIDNPMGLFEHLDACANTCCAVFCLAITQLLHSPFSHPSGAALSPLEADGIAGCHRVTEPIGTVMRVSLLTGLPWLFPILA